MKKILLIALTVPEIMSGDYIDPKEIKRLSDLGTSGKRAFTPPLNLATIAALTPDDIDVTIWDETVHGLVDVNVKITDYDLAGITGYTYNIPRAIKVAALFRSHNIPVAIGGVGVSMEPEACRGHFDILFIGEAELTWPQFILDWKKGSYKDEYRQIVKPDLTISPIPKWDSIADSMHKYLIGGVQTTRGCPFNCEFCDITYLFGKKSRHKPIDTILAEVANLQRLGIGYIFFNDDNFIGSPKFAKKLLRKLIPLNNSFESPLEFGTQVSINVAHDDELLELLSDANFGMLLIGIESVNEESLKETNKIQNLNRDLVADCIKVQSYGMYIKGAMIVGFDSDDKSIFDKQFDFLQKAHIPVFNLNQLKAPTGTKLWRRLLREGRVLKTEIPEYDDSLLALATTTNIIPKQMTRAELLSGTIDLTLRLRSWDNFIARIKGYVSGIRRIPRVAYRKRNKISLKQLYMVLRFLFAVDKETRRAVVEIISYTKKNAPFLMRRVLAITFTNFSTHYLIQLKKREMEELIEIEKGLNVEKYVDHSPILIPKTFEDSFQNIYLGVYERVMSGLDDKTLADEVLVDVFTDFLTRSGKTFDQLSDHHMAFLNDLCDLSVNRCNLEGKKETMASNQSGAAIPVFKKSSSEDLLNIIEQKLRA